MYVFTAQPQCHLTYDNDVVCGETAQHNVSPVPQPQIPELPPCPTPLVGDILLIPRINGSASDVSVCPLDLELDLQMIVTRAARPDDRN